MRRSGAARRRLRGGGAGGALRRRGRHQSLRAHVRHLEQDGDALLDRRVCVEDAARLLGLLVLERVGDVEVRRGAVGVAQRPRVGGDVVERARQAEGVARELDAAGVRQVLAAPRDRRTARCRRPAARGWPARWRRP